MPKAASRKWGCTLQCQVCDTVTVGQVCKLGAHVTDTLVLRVRGCRLQDAQFVRIKYPVQSKFVSIVLNNSIKDSGLVSYHEPPDIFGQV